MRAMIGFGLFLSGCSLLPHNQVFCTDSDRCDSDVPEPFVLGKPDARSNPYTLPIDNPIGVALTPDGKLIVADGTANLLRVWTTFPTRNYQAVDFVLGKDNASIATLTMDQYVARPAQFTTDGTQLVVMGDPTSFGGNGNQLYYWPTFPTQHTLWTSQWSLARTGTPSARTVGNGSPLIVGARFYLSDQQENRLLTWNAIPTTAADANGVIGQASFTVVSSNVGMPNPDNPTLSYPTGSPASDGTQLVVPDSGNNRVLIWSALPTSTAAKAQSVLGQGSFTDGEPYQGGNTPSLTTLNNPTAVALSNGHLAVADSGTNRVLLWNNTFAGMGQPADVVLGQPGPSTASANSGGVSAATMAGPGGVATDGNRLVVSDTGNHRVLIWNSWPTRHGTPADLILGQPAPDLSSAGGIYAGDNSFLAPVALAHGTTAFYVVESNAHRVLIYDAPPTSPADRPHFVLGQPDFVTTALSTPGPSAHSFNTPIGASADGDTLAVADTNNNRVLIWRSTPTQNQQDADVVLGHDTLTVATVNDGMPALGLSSPRGVFLGGGKLYVADTNNHRVLIWNSVPTQNHQPPDIVLGQATATVIMPNRGLTIPSDLTLSGPTAVVADATSIYVCDTSNDRILIWQTLNPTTGQAADRVVGQPTFANYSPPSMPLADAFINPVGLSIYNGRLYVADSGDNRIVYFDVQQLGSSAPGQSVPAQGVYGQTDLTSGAPNAGGIAADRFYTPVGVLALPNGLYIADRDNGRIVALPPSSGATSPAP